MNGELQARLCVCVCMRVCVCMYVCVCKKDPQFKVSNDNYGSYKPQKKECKQLNNENICIQLTNDHNYIEKWEIQAKCYNMCNTTSTKHSKGIEHKQKAMVREQYENGSGKRKKNDNQQANSSRSDVSFKWLGMFVDCGG